MKCLVTLRPFRDDEVTQIVWLFLSHVQTCSDFFGIPYGAIRENILQNKDLRPPIREKSVRMLRSPLSASDSYG